MLAQQIADLLKSSGYQWSKDGVPFCPDEKKVQKLLDEAQAMLYTGDIGTQYERGGIIVQKNLKQTYDVFLRIGEINERL